MAAILPYYPDCGDYTFTGTESWDNSAGTSDRIVTIGYRYGQIQASANYDVVTVVTDDDVEAILERRALHRQWALAEQRYLCSNVHPRTPHTVHQASAAKRRTPTRRRTATGVRNFRAANRG